MDFNSGMCYNPSAEYMEIVGKEEKFMQEQIPVRKVDTGKYMKIIRSLLEEGKEVPLVVTGNSMLPFLVDGRDQVLIKEVNRSLRKGDIAFFQRKNGQYIMHRIRRQVRRNTGLWETGRFIPKARLNRNRYLVLLLKLSEKEKESVRRISGGFFSDISGLKLYHFDH